MPRPLRVLLAILLGFAGGWIATFGGYVAFTELASYSDREGATAMAFAFLIGPLVGLIAALAAGIAAARRPHATG